MLSKYTEVILLGKVSDSFKEQLREKGYKLTVQRQAVLDVISEHEGEHMSSEEIYENVKKNYPDIGLATVYRTLILLNQLGLIYKIDFDDGRSRYELNRENEDHRHHHLICTECGSVKEVEEDLLEALENQIFDNKGFIVKNHKVQFYGICKKCGENMKSET